MVSYMGNVVFHGVESCRVRLARYAAMETHVKSTFISLSLTPWRSPLYALRHQHFYRTQVLWVLLLTVKFLHLGSWRSYHRALRLSSQISWEQSAFGGRLDSKWALDINVSSIRNKLSHLLQCDTSLASLAKYVPNFPLSNFPVPLMCGPLLTTLIRSLFSSLLHLHLWIY